jgi:hypothetical protein
LFSPCPNISEADEQQLQQAVCRCFEQWGLPKSIRVDNGRPFGDPQRSSVPVLALWLTGLGIEVIWNRPRCPRDNATVERMQATSSRWAEVEQCSNCAQLQYRLDQVAKVQREQYQVRRMGQKSRKELYPAVWSNTRVYGDGSSAFDLLRVRDYLSRVTFVRKVSKKGCINFYAQKVHVGCRYHNQYVSLHYDAQTNSFKVEDENKTAIGHFTADNFSQQNIVNLSVCQNRYLNCQNLMSQ